MCHLNLRFLLELGAGFSYIGRQYRLEVAGDEFFVDLLFYHLRKQTRGRESSAICVWRAPIDVPRLMVPRLRLRN